ncbi:MAG: lactate racemase domain-containing protein [bacterium]|nr:lactate racemase domain-containing protein [bacterium]
MGNTATIHTGAWVGDTERTLTFPETWTVNTYGPKEVPKITEAQIQDAFDNPIGSARLSDLARGKQSAAIIVDDLSRPTPAAELIPFVLQELADAGVPKNEIRFVVGGGSHRPLEPEEIDKKVGADVAKKHEVTSHNFMSGDLRALGSLDSGLPIYINKVVADSEFKLCVGGLYPHGAVGFGGGAKLILPGVSGFATMFYFHTFYASRGVGNIERRGNEPDHRDAAEDVARVLGLDAVVNVTLNRKREITAVFVGDFIKAQRAGARYALETYSTQVPEEAVENTDLVIANCYPLDYDPIQAGKSLWPLRKFPNAYKVAINPATDGICYHGLFDRIDYARFCMEKARQPEQELPVPQIEGSDQILMWSEHFPVDDFYKRNNTGVLFRDWETLQNQLIEKLPDNARVAVFPNAAIQVPT